MAFANGAAPSAGMLTMGDCHPSGFDESVRSFVLFKTCPSSVTVRTLGADELKSAGTCRPPSTSMLVPKTSHVIAWLGALVWRCINGVRWRKSEPSGFWAASHA